MTQSRYLEYLPAIFHSDDLEQPESFLGDFLLSFECRITAFEALLTVLDDYFDPALTAPDYLPWLAHWVALTLDQTWTETTKRRLISEAMALHRIRGTVNGLKRFLAIWDEQSTVQIRERRWPSGMQIGVSSQIGGARFDQAIPKQFEYTNIQNTVLQQTYYVIDTVGNPALPCYPAEVHKGVPLRVYYRSDQVKSVDIGYKADTQYVEIQRFDDVRCHYEPATITRHEQVAVGPYRLNAESGAVDYIGDTFLVDELELPYRFTVDILIPWQNWVWLFDGQLDKTPDFQKLFANHGFTLSNEIVLEKEPHGDRWWKISDGDKLYLAERRGNSLKVYQQRQSKDRMMDKLMQDKLKKYGSMAQTIINELKPAHTIDYLNLKPDVSERRLESMQIGVRSLIDLDTTIG